jgi:cell shape-determining protein MreC
MRRPRRRWTIRNVLGVMAAISLAGLMLPKALTGRLMSLVQVILPFQDAAGSMASAAGDLIEFSPSRPVSAEQHAAVQRENQALRHALAALTMRVDGLQRERDALARIRARGLHDGRLIPARVVAADALAWRESRLVNAGTLRGVREEAAVASHHFSVEADANAQPQSGQAVLAGEILVGFVDQAGTHSARVVLLTDPQTRMRVRVARCEEQGCAPLDADFWLVGDGGAVLRILDVDHRYIKSGAIQEGDLVFSAPTDALPIALTIGSIKSLRADPDNSLLYVVDVAPPLALHEIRDVLIVDRAGFEAGAK